MTSPTLLRFGIVGSGRMAVRMAAALARTEGARIVAIASGSPARAERFAAALEGARAHPTVASLLADGAVDAVYVANTTAEHVGTTLAAVRAGKPVLCEKPLATDAAAARSIAAAASEHGSLVMEAMWTLFLPAYERLATLVRQRDGTRQGPRHLYADFGYPASSADPSHLRAPGPGAGVLLDRGVYPLALALRLFGAIEEVSGFVARSPGGVDEHAALLLRHSHGDQSQVCVSSRLLLQNRVAVSFAEEMIALEPSGLGSEQLRTFTHHAQRVDADPLDATAAASGWRDALRAMPLARRLYGLRSSGSIERRPFGGDPYVPMLEHFCALVRDGRAQSDVVPCSLSTAVLAAIDVARALPGGTALQEPKP